MSEHVRTPEEIEREIELERSNLSSTMRHLQDRFSTDGIVREVIDSVGEHSADIAGAAVRVARRNPAAVALTGLGLAWLAASSARRGREGDGYHRMGTDPNYPVYGEVHENVGRGQPYGSHPIDPRPRGPVRADGTAEGESPWDAAAGRVAGFGRSARERYDRLSESARGAKDAAGRRFSEASSRGRAYGAQAGASARHLRDRIADGTSGMSEEAKRRVIAARTRAYEAQVRAEYFAREGSRRAGDFYDEQPLVVGALAVAIGAAIGGALPRTNREDEAFGAWRDDLFHEAQRIYEEERAKLSAVARDTAEEAKHQARDLAETVKADARGAAEDVRAKAREAADEVAETAKTDAKARGVGDSVS